jgi:hypothetical protein
MSMRAIGHSPFQGAQKTHGVKAPETNFRFLVCALNFDGCALMNIGYNSHGVCTLPIIDNLLPHHLRNDRVLLTNPAGTLRSLGPRRFNGMDQQRHLISSSLARFQRTPFFLFVVFNDRDHLGATRKETRLTEKIRFGIPEEVENLVLFLAFDESTFVTGPIVSIHGGLISDV